MNNQTGMWYPNGVAQAFQYTLYPVWGSPRVQVTFKPGARERLAGETCRWTFCEDYRFRGWCCAIPVQFGQTLGSQDNQWRLRLLFIVCPEDGEPYVEDRTAEYLEGTYFEELLGPQAGWWGECLSPPEYAPYLDWYPDPEPVCNEFP